MVSPLTTLTATLLLIGAGPVWAASSQDLTVKGVITPSACAPVVSGGGTVDFGKVSVKDLNTDIEGRHVLVVEDIIDTGLTLAYLIQNLNSRKPASLKIMTMFRKPDALSSPVEVAHVGFDLPNEFVVGYGLDYAGRYRNLVDVATLAPHVYS